MNATERKEIRRAKVMLLAGDRASALGLLRALESTPTRSAYAMPRQMVLAFMTFRCETLAVEDMPAHVCVTRQAVSEIQRTRQTTRGQGTTYPTCDTRSCAQGRCIREALDPDSRISWRGAGPGGRFEPGRSGKEAQATARERLRRVGLLERVPTMDSAGDRARPGDEEG